MSSKPVVSMRELEMESVELLPSRETLCVHKYAPAHSSSSTAAAGNGIGNAGNTAQSGNGDVSFANGNLSDDFSGNTILVNLW